MCIGGGGDKAVEGQATALGSCLSKMESSRSDSLAKSWGCSKASSVQARASQFLTTNSLENCVNMHVRYFSFCSTSTNSHNSQIVKSTILFNQLHIGD